MANYFICISNWSLNVLEKPQIKPHIILDCKGLYSNIPQLRQVTFQAVQHISWLQV